MHKPEITLQLGSVPPLTLSIEIRAGLTIDAAGSCRVEVPGAGAFRVDYGSLVTVESSGDDSIESLRRVLLGSGLAILCHQRGILPLHGSCIERQGRAVIFLGRSGAGKSTLAACFATQGGSVVCDDVCIVERSDDSWKVRRFSKTLRLLPDSCGRVLDQHSVAPDGEKQEVRVGDNVTADEEDRIQLQTICCLHRTENGVVRIEPIAAKRRTQSVLEHVYRHRLGLVLGRGVELFESVTELVGDVAVFNVRRPFDFDVAQAVAQQISQIVFQERWGSETSQWGADRHG